MDFDRSEDQTAGSPWAGIASLTLGILASALQLATCCVPAAPAFVFFCALAGVLCSWLALRNGADLVENRALAATGLVINLINLILSVGLMLLSTSFLAVLLALISLDP